MNNEIKKEIQRQVNEMFDKELQKRLEEFFSHSIRQVKEFLIKSIK